MEACCTSRGTKTRTRDSLEINLHETLISEQWSRPGHAGTSGRLRVVASGPRDFSDGHAVKMGNFGNGKDGKLFRCENVITSGACGDKIPRNVYIENDQSQRCFLLTLELPNLSIRRISKFLNII